MNKRILISLSVIGLVAAIAIGGTIAYFSDTETSVGNTFTAGTIDISLDPSDGQAVETVSGDLDLKPCQTGYTTAAITNDGTNPAEIWKHIGEVKNIENGKVEPEKEYYNTYGWDWADALISDWIHYDMEVYKSLGYSYTDSIDILQAEEDLKVTVVDGDGWVTWTFDLPVEEWTGNGQISAFVAISLDGVTPAFLIHNNDGMDSTYEWGTWLYSAYDEGWHCDVNTPVSDIGWVQASGERYAQGTEGILQIKISKCELGETFSWTARTWVGSGWNDISPEYMTIGTADWEDVPNFIEATIATLIKEIPESRGWFLTYKGPKVHPDNDGYGVESNWIYLGELEPEECMCVIQSYHLDADVDNWGQSDKVSFDVDFMAQQTTGNPPQPSPVLPGQGR